MGYIICWFLLCLSNVEQISNIINKITIKIRSTNYWEFVNPIRVIFWILSVIILVYSSIFIVSVNKYFYLILSLFLCLIGYLFVLLLSKINLTLYDNIYNVFHSLYLLQTQFLKCTEGYGNLISEYNSAIIKYNKLKLREYSLKSILNDKNEKFVPLAFKKDIQYPLFDLRFIYFDTGYKMYCRSKEYIKVIDQLQEDIVKQHNAVKQTQSLINNINFKIEPLIYKNEKIIKLYLNEALSNEAKHVMHSISFELLNLISETEKSVKQESLYEMLSLDNSEKSYKNRINFCYQNFYFGIENSYRNEKIGIILRYYDIISKVYVNLNIPNEVKQKNFEKICVEIGIECKKQLENIDKKGELQ